MSPNLNESVAEEETLNWLRDLGYAVEEGEAGKPGPHRESLGEVVLAGRLRAAVDQLNPKLPAQAREEAVRKLLLQELPALLQQNRQNHALLVDGVEVEYRKDGRIVGDRVGVIDFDDPDNNDWLAVNQFTVIEDRHNRRPDVVVFVNGLPLAVIELKNPADENATIWHAFKQFQTYKQRHPAPVRTTTSCWSSRTAWRPGWAR